MISIPRVRLLLLHEPSRTLISFRIIVKKTMEELRVDMILGERLDLASTTSEAAKFNERGQRVVKTVTGREVAADVLVSEQTAKAHSLSNSCFLYNPASLHWANAQHGAALRDGP